MNETRKSLLELARRTDISQMGLREIAREIGVKNPQNVKFHLRKLQESGELRNMNRPTIKINKDLLGSSSLIQIPILGNVSAGPATQLAGDQPNGFVSVSSALLETKNFKDLYALKVVGTSMNAASVKGEPVNDGDIAIVDSSRRSPRDGDYVIAVVDDLANLKKYHLDYTNQQVVLLSESLDDYSPIFVDLADSNENLIRGTVVRVMHLPQAT